MPDNRKMGRDETSTFLAAIQNADSKDCGNSTFAYTVTSPLEVVISGATRIVPPGGIAYVPFTVRTLSDTNFGDYPVVLFTTNITTGEISNGGAKITVGESCVRGQASMVLLESNLHIPRTATGNFVMTLTNLDSPQCYPSIFYVTTSSAYPISSGVVYNSIYLPPGESADVYITATVAADAPNGVFPLSINTKNASSKTDMGTIDASVTVS